MNLITAICSKSISGLTYYILGTELTIGTSTAVIIILLTILLIVGVIVLMIFQYRHMEAMSILKEKSKALTYLASHDSLTGLYNRMTFMEKLQEKLIDKSDIFIVLYIIDITNIKMINDAYGYDVGDRLLMHAAASIKDEFSGTEAIIGSYLTDFLVADSSKTAIEEVSREAARLVSRLSAVTPVDHMDISPKINIGIALSPDHSMEAGLLLKKANMANLEAMKMGPNKYNIFKSNIYTDALKRITLEKQLKRAISKNEFEIYYQPRIRIPEHSVCGCEALIRWNHPDGKVVYPGHFIGIAESLGFISEITRWVIRNVAVQANMWAAEGYQIKISFNISGKEFDDEFIRMLSQILHEEHCDPGLLEVEITETATLKDMDHSKILVNTLKDLGVSVALDDFGTGYSSMTYIKKLSADKLKIDRSFIEDIGDLQQRTVVESMIDLGRKLNYIINVEGVETKEQLSILESMEVDEIQGWYFSKAVKADAFIDYVNRSRMSRNEKMR